ncbi:MAG: hypothetical protein JW950_03065 [Deltaproteobacteria bacterium]|nr:hypothetical protein [Deltaproteobacteria bacterium]
MALDEPRDDDQIFDDKGIKFLIEKELFEQVKPVNVDYIDTVRGSGFKVTSALSAESACGSCTRC